ncbi:uncharacterized protein LOC134256654 [Saccostrea cucullata]|uniref:uncharacterized protein LOC134256654 n=1 Tax=Saccostrea cuccullata TaxID=36930 RepID=UPI002ED0448B
MMDWKQTCSQGICVCPYSDGHLYKEKKLLRTEKKSSKRAKAEECNDQENKRTRKEILEKKARDNSRTETLLHAQDYILKHVRNFDINTSPCNQATPPTLKPPSISYSPTSTAQTNIAPPSTNSPLISITIPSYPPATSITSPSFPPATPPSFSTATSATPPSFLPATPPSLSPATSITPISLPPATSATPSSFSPATPPSFPFVANSTSQPETFIVQPLSSSLSIDQPVDQSPAPISCSFTAS